MSRYLPERKIKVTHVLNAGHLSCLYLILIALGFNNQTLDLILATLALILFIYSFIETRKGYLILQIKDNQLVLYSPFRGKTKIAIDSITHIQQEKKKTLLEFYIYTKNEEVIIYSTPAYLYSINPLLENSHRQLDLEKKIKQFFEEISDYLKQYHEKES